MINQITQRIKQLEPPISIGLGLGVVVLIYSYVCRSLNLFFFWESRFVGWILIAVFTLFLLMSEMNKAKRKEQNTIGFKIVMGILLFVGIFSVTLWTVLHRTEAYEYSKAYIFSNEDIRKDLGGIKDVVLYPQGSINVRIKTNGKEGNSTLVFLVKGSNAYRDITLHSQTTIEDDEWKIYEVE